MPMPQNNGTTRRGGAPCVASRCNVLKRRVVLSDVELCRVVVCWGVVYCMLVAAHLLMLLPRVTASTPKPPLQY